MNNTAQNKKGFAPIVLLAVVAIIAVIAVLLFATNKKEVNAPESASGTLPPVGERMNPDPVSGNSIYVKSIDPGTQVMVTELTMEKSGYVVVQRESASGTRTTIGKSDLIDAGTYSDLAVTTQELKDGEAVYVGLQNANGGKVVDENDNTIEVFVNVGMLSGHQMNDIENDYY